MLPKAVKKGLKIRQKEVEVVNIKESLKNRVN